MTCDIALPNVQQLQPYVAGKPIEEVQREYGLDHVVKLASNENPYGASPLAIEAALKAMREISRYPDASGWRLKQALASYYNIEPNQITLGNGSNEVLVLLTRVFATRQHSVVYSEHGFAVYRLATQGVGSEALIAPAVNYGHDLPAMAGLVKANTKIIFIANPNNPTGTWVSGQAICDLLESVPSNVLVVLDEAYAEYVDFDRRYDSLALLAKYPNLVICRTFSKAHGLASLRVGYCLSSPDVADMLNRVRDAFNVNSTALAAAEAAIQDKTWIESAKLRNDLGLKQLGDAFDAMNLGFIPSQANFLTLKVGKNASALNQSLLQHGVIVRPVAGDGLPQHLRVSVGTSAENQVFIDAMNVLL